MQSTLIQRSYEARRKSIHLLRARGWSLERIAARWGITKQRVHQILTRPA